jgi:hypothetical protein
MFFSDKITLRAVVNGVDSNGYPTQENNDTEVWANVKSATRQNFIRLMRMELMCRKCLKSSGGWGGQTQVVYDGKT